MTDKRLTKVSKFISLVLRHKQEEIGLRLDSAGWANVNELLFAMQRHCVAIDMDQLVEIVATDEKQRYQFSADQTKIRASQGHSIDIDLQYERQVPPDVLYHGTASRFMDSIKESGLEKRGRNHVHLSLSREVAKSVGQRHGKPVILTIDAARMHRDGHAFYRSDNNVWLTDAVPVEYIRFEPD